MRFIPYTSSGRRLLILFALPVFCLLVLELETQTKTARAEPEAFAAQEQPGAAGQKPKPTLVRQEAREASQAQIEVPVPIFGGKKSEADIISSSGPAFPAAFTMSSFTVKGFVKGRWPIVIDYELEAESTAEVTISIKDTKQPFVIKLEPTNDQHKEVVRQLPEEFGSKPQVGTLSFQAFKNGTGARRPARFFLYGLGVGDRAVGSMVIDQLQFQPGQIRPKLKEKASYSFRSLSDFNTGSADFLLLTLAPDGRDHRQLAYREMLKKGVLSGQTFRKDWDGKNTKGKVSQGPHQFHVRVWRGLKKGGDWVFAAKKQIVRVE